MFVAWVQTTDTITITIQEHISKRPYKVQVICKLKRNYWLENIECCTIVRNFIFLLISLSFRSSNWQGTYPRKKKRRDGKWWWCGAHAKSTQTTGRQRNWIATQKTLLCSIRYREKPFRRLQEQDGGKVVPLSTRRYWYNSETLRTIWAQNTQKKFLWRRKFFRLRRGTGEEFNIRCWIMESSVHFSRSIIEARRQAKYGWKFIE